MNIFLPRIHWMNHSECKGKKEKNTPTYQGRHKVSLFYFVIVFFPLSFFLTQKTFAQANIIWQEDFDAGGTNWVLENAPGSKTNPTPAGIPGLTYTPNGACNNYWIINNANVPDKNNANYPIRSQCGQTPGVNKSLHITYRACAGVNGIEPEPPDGGDAYSWKGASSNSDQIAYYNANISTVGYCNLILQFDAYLGGDSLGTLTDRSVLYSTDGGATWKVLVDDLNFNYSAAGTCFPWKTFTIPFPTDAENIPNLRIAFRWRNENPNPINPDQYSLSSAFNVDNIQIISLDNPASLAPTVYISPNPACNQQQVTLLGNSGITSNAFFYDLFLNYQWNVTGPGSVTYVNGTSNTDKTAQIQVNGAGNYNVQLTVSLSNSCGNVSGNASSTLTVNPCPPVASFLANLTTVCASGTSTSGDTLIYFTDASQSYAPITSYNWSFNPGTVTFMGGTSASSANPIVRFDAPGIYTVTLTVTSSDGSDDTTFTIEAVNCQCASAGGGGSPQQIWFEDFGTGCNACNLADGTTTANGTWTETLLPGNGTESNRWYISATTDGSTPVGNCEEGCIKDGPGFTNRTLHVAARQSNCTFLGFPIVTIDCDRKCGYFADGTCDQNYATDVRVESPTINTSGYTSLTLSFKYTKMGNPPTSDGEIWGFDGTTWQLIANPPPTGNGSCSDWNYNGLVVYKVGVWGTYSVTLPAWAENNPNFKLGFRWYNPDADPSPADPAFAIDSILITGVSMAGGPNGVFTCPIVGPLCAGDSVLVTFNAQGTFNPGNQFIVQLSDASGSFASPTVLGSMTQASPFTNPLSIKVQIPPGTPPGTAYRIRVISTDPPYNSPPDVQDNGSDLTIIVPPAVPSITGPATVCAADTGVVYSTPAQTNVTYNWEVINGSITTGQGTNSIKVNWSASATSGQVIVHVSNTCGTFSDTLDVTILNGPSLTAVTGPNAVCVNTTHTYETDTLSGASYTWSIVSGSGTIVSGQGTPAVQINWTATGPALIKVLVSTSCGDDSLYYAVNVTGPPTSPVISGPTSVCPNDTATYTVPYDPTLTYTWSVSGGTIIGGQGTNGIDVQWGGVGSGTVSVQVSNTCGTASSAPLNVTISGTVSITGFAGPDTVCAVSDSVDANYSVGFLASATYTWTVTGGNIVSGQGTNAVTVRWDTVSAVHTLQVQMATSCGTDDTTITVTVLRTPVPISPISGKDTVCLNATETYSVTGTAVNSFQWSVTGGTILSGQGTNTIQVQWTSTGNQTITVKDSTYCGVETQTLAVLVTSGGLPITNFTGNLTPCATGATVTETYSVDSIPGATYSWTVTGGTILGSSTDSSVTVQWDAFAGSWSIQVSQTTACGVTDSIYTVTLQFPPNLTSITGKDTVCPNTTEAYSVTLSGSGAGVTYTWQLINGNGTITPSGNNASIQWTTSGNDTIRVIASNSCGNDTILLPVYVRTYTQVNAISGNVNNICTGTTETYSVPLITGASYTWTITPAETFTGQGTNSIQVTWNTPGTYNVEVSITQSCGTQVLDTTVNVITDPVLNPISGPTSVCIGQTGTYQITGNWGSVTWSTIGSGTIIGSSTNTAVTVQWNGNGSVVVEVVGALCGTIQRDTLSVTASSRPVADILATPLSVCEGDPVQFQDNTVPAPQYIVWDFGDGATDTGSTSVTHVFSGSGTYTVTLIAGPNVTCADTDTVTITVVPLPQVSIYANPNPLYLPDQATIGANVQNVDTLYWDLGDSVTQFVQIGSYPSFTSNYPDQGTYLIVAIGANSLGCRVADTLTLIVYRSMKIFIPNAFTPNGDQHNDYFEIVTDGVESYTIDIYDRWGNLIATLNTNQKWDGTVNGAPAPEGVYVVHVKAKGFDGKRVERTASVTLIR